MSIKSAWPENANLHRAASRGKVFTRTERVNLIKNAGRKQARSNSIQKERERYAEERAARAQSFRILHAMEWNPEEKIKRKKDGTAYIQRRVKGKFQAQELIF